MGGLMNADLEKLRDDVRAFAAERDWEQFHTPKNLVMALAVESAELMEHFQWLTPDQSVNLNQEAKGKVAEEIADVLIYLVRLSDILGVDLLDAAFNKMGLNRAKYPVNLSKGLATKYTELGKE